MRITIQAPSEGGPQLESNRELQRAFVVLHRADIQTRGGGQFADSSIAIILSHEADAVKALAALKLAGIRALAS
jgi:hypothetical protein